MLGIVKKTEVLRAALSAPGVDCVFRNKFGEVDLERIHYCVERVALAPSALAQEAAYKELTQFVARKLASLMQNTRKEPETLDELRITVRSAIHQYIVALRTTTLSTELQEAYFYLMDAIGKLVTKNMPAVRPAWPGADSPQYGELMLGCPSGTSDEMPEYMCPQVFDTPPVIEDVDALLRENRELRLRIDALNAARIAYASEFPLTEDGEPDVGNIHANIRRLKAQLKNS